MVAENTGPGARKRRGPLLFAAPPDQQVWLSTRAGSGGFVMAYQAPPGRALAVDIGQVPAVILDRPACEEEGPCQGVRLRLDRSARRLAR